MAGGVRYKVLIMLGKKMTLASFIPPNSYKASTHQIFHNEATQEVGQNPKQSNHLHFHQRLWGNSSANIITISLKSHSSGQMIGQTSWPASHLIGQQMGWLLMLAFVQTNIFLSSQFNKPVNAFSNQKSAVREFTEFLLIYVQCQAIKRNSFLKHPSLFDDSY